MTEHCLMKVRRSPFHPCWRSRLQQLAKYRCGNGCSGANTDADFSFWHGFWVKGHRLIPKTAADANRGITISLTAQIPQHKTKPNPEFAQKGCKLELIWSILVMKLQLQLSGRDNSKVLKMPLKHSSGGFRLNVGHRWGSTLLAWN